MQRELWNLKDDESHQNQTLAAVLYFQNQKLGVVSR